MRRRIRSVGVLFVALLGTIGLAIGSAFTAALAFGAIGLFVPGTVTPDANGVANYLSNARDRYTLNTPCNSEANCPTILENSQDPSLLGINYPASFFPLVIFPGWCRSGADGCDKWNVSVGKGTDALDLALTPYLSEDSTEEVTLFGYSQGGAVVSNELQRIAAMGLADSVLARLHVVTIGGIQNPDGGLWQRLGFLPTIPFFDISFGPAMKTDNGFDTTAIGFEYDPVTYAPRYWGNPLALLNAIAALGTVHGYYLAPNGNGPTDTLPYGYTPPSLTDPTDQGTLLPQLDCSVTGHPDNCRYGSSGETTYIMIPATSLPIFDLITQILPAPLRPIFQPIVNLLTPVTKQLIDLGYDWGGDPDKPTPLSILPFNPFTFNPIDFSVKFVQAIGQGIQDVINGGPSTAFGPTAVFTNQVQAVQSLPRLAAVPAQDDTPATVVGKGNRAPVQRLVEQKSDDNAAAEPGAVAEDPTEDAATDDPTADANATADNAAADAKEAADNAAAEKSTKAADKAAAARSKRLAAKEAAAQAVADEAKEAAQNAKDAGAAGGNDDKVAGTTTTTGTETGTGDTEQKAA